MSKRQFTRLFIVLFIPLLLLGFILGKAVFHNTGGWYAYILCIPSSSFENCRQVGDPDGNLYQLTKDYYPSWFDITEASYDSDAPLSNFIMGSTRIVRDATVIGARPFAGYGPETESFMSALVGSRVAVKLGMEKGERSIISNDGVLLFCNSLQFNNEADVFSSQCFGDGWGGVFDYSVSGPSLQELHRLSAAIEKEVDSRKTEYNLFRAVFYPIFIYLFLIVSLLTWLGVKAAKFVKNG